MEYIIWGVGVAGIFAYSVIMLIFLGQLYKEGLLISWKGANAGRSNIVCFSQDIFDVAWLIIMWLPLTLLACAFAVKVREEDWGPLLIAWGGIALVAFVIAMASLSKFNNENKKRVTSNESLVWSGRMRPLARTLYNFLQCYTGGVLSLSAVLTSYFLVLTCGGIGCPPEMYAYALVSSLVFLTFFVMNTLSKMAIDVKLGTRQGKDLFPWWQYIAGPLLVLLFSITLVLCLGEAQEETMAGYLDTIFQGSVIPLIPIIIQLVQIVFPVKK